MKKSTIFQGSMREPNGEEDWKNLSVEQKDKIINRQSIIICLLLLVIVYLSFQ